MTDIIEAARAVAERRWPMPDCTDCAGIGLCERHAGDPLAMLDEGMGAGFVLGAQWAEARHRTMTTRDTIERALRAHEVEAVTGGTATGSTWRCACGAGGPTDGTRDWAHALWRYHVADAIEWALGMITPTPLDPAHSDGGVRLEPAAVAARTAEHFGTYAPPTCEHERTVEDATYDCPDQIMCADCGCVLRNDDSTTKGTTDE